jgi:2-haloalkanoic acid dehalogenase type II
MRLGDFKVLSFDCYGTLIDWESGIYAALQPLLRRGGLDLERERVLESFARHESAEEAATPGMRYGELLAVVHARLAKEWGVAVEPEEDRQFGRSVPEWPAFPDSAAALRALKRHYKLVILSNVDRAGFRASNEKLGVEFDAVYTAEDIGSYKPDPRNFEYMLSRLASLGFGPKDVLHTAQSLYHDHAPASRFGLATAWIDRRQDRGGWGATMPPPAEARYDFRFGSMAEMAEAHRKELASSSAPEH